MKEYRADLHIHSVLSPCASLDMSPDNIIKSATEKGIDIIGIADHNTTKQCGVIKQLGEENDVLVLCGAEVNTKEEVHCLAFFENDKLLNDFQIYLDQHLPVVKNKPELFGDQIWVDKYNNILGEEDRLLIIGLNQSIDQVANKVESLGGIFIPAHVDKSRFSVSSQLGFLAADLNVSAVEVSRLVDMEQFSEKHKWVNDYSIVANSDAHTPDQIGSVNTSLLLNEATFNEVKEALLGKNGRKIININLYS
ncbi:PHP domain-containing protein [Labilibacter sediminis]|nr:PHP domain-containing protein [Labilibacter sediminis]